jgi:hypothetical protein
MACFIHFLTYITIQIRVKFPPFVEIAKPLLPIGREGHKLLASSLTARFRTRGIVDRPLGQQISNKAHLDHSICRKLSLLLCMQFLYFPEMFTLMR